MRLFTFETANADFITGSLAIGGDLAYDADTALAQAVELADGAGITHVLDCRYEARERLWAQFPAVEYGWHGIDDRPGAASGDWFERITDWAVAAIAAGGIVLTHCHMGINRGPSAGYAVLLRLGWDPVEALDAIRRARPIANIAFAEDAVDWHLDRIGTSAADRRAMRRRISQWREENPLDVVRIIRAEREREAGWAA